MSQVPRPTAQQVYRRRWIAGSGAVVLLLSVVIGTGIVRPSPPPAAPGPTPRPTLVASAAGMPPSDRASIPVNGGKLAAPTAAQSEFDYVWNVPPLPATVPVDLRERLAGEVGQVVKAGHLAPLPLIGGIGFASGSYSWDLGGAKYGPYTLAWLNPADTILALSQAFPLLPPDQHGTLRPYLRAELDAYPIDSFAIGAAFTMAKPSEGSDYYRGVRRETFPLPPDLTYNLWPPLRPPVENLYALWAYANATEDWAYLQGRWPTMSALFTGFAARGAPDTYGQIGGLIGFARIAQHLGHEPEAQSAADLAVRGLRAGADFATFVKTADSRRSNTHAVAFPVFSYLTPEVGAYLRDHSRDAVAAYVADATATENLPTWYLAWGEQTMGGENAYLSPDVAWQIFLAKAYILTDAEQDLRRYLDQPWSVGDPYFIQKLVATMGAGQETVSALSAAPHITDFTDNRGAFPNGQPPVAERFEATFRVAGGAATNPMIPYDPHAPPGVEGGAGISVDALFSADQWATTIAQPGFLYQDYTRSELGGREILTPRGEPLWKVRFAFPTPGAWRFRLVVHDAAGSTRFPADHDLTVAVAPRTSRGFIHVSAADPRYFSYDDGTTFNPAGFNEGFDRTRFTFDTDAKIAQWEGSGLDLLRLWMSGSGLVGASWLPWRSMTLPYDGYLPATGLVADHPDGEIPFTFRLDGANRCMAYGVDDSPALAMQPGHTYRLTLRARTDGIVAEAGGGFTVQLADALDGSCGTGPVATPLIPPVTGSTEWQTLTTTVTLRAGADRVPRLALTLARASGAAYVSAISLRDIAADSAATDLITRSPATLLGGFDLAAAWQWDYLLDTMQARGIGAKIVLLEKNDWSFNHLGRDGKPVVAAPPGNTNFYAAPGTAIRAYQEYYWRAVLARWSAYRSVHSWELLNEGDPDSPDHAALAGDFARFMHANDTALHPVTTSSWAGFPLSLITSAGLDYADIHLYEDTSMPRPPWQLPAPAALDRQTADATNGHGQTVRLPAGVDGEGEKASIGLHGKGKWTLRVDMRAEGLTGTCPYGASADLAGPQLLWRLDTGVYAGSEDRGAGIVPPAPSGQAFVCSSPAGTHGWQTFTGGFTLDDDAPHLLSLSFRTRFATSGVAWFDNLSIVAPDGRPLPLLGDGTFDDTASPSLDLARGTALLGERYGALSPAGAGMPLVRGETGLGRGQSPREEPDLLRDRDGVWLHALLWSQLAPGGATNLPWYRTSIDANALWRLFAPYQAFLAGIPLAAGGYVDAGASASDVAIRVLGQKHPGANRAYLWIRNAGSTWQGAVAGAAPPAAGGTVTLALAPGNYRVEWWSTTTGAITHVDTIAAPDGRVTMPLPQPIATDIAVRIAPA